MSDIDERGPFFIPGLSERVMRKAAEGIAERVGQRGSDLVHERLHEVLRHPTGYYESRVTTRLSGTTSTIDGGGVVYGPWLEGVGSRNRSTRFKGYHTFRDTEQRVESESGDVADPIIDHAVRELN